MRKLALPFLLLAACAPPEPLPTVADAVEALDASKPIAVLRERVFGDIYHYQYDLPAGATPNARIRVHRVVREESPWHPHETDHAVMLLHGDFANFVTNFVPTLGASPSTSTGLAPYLARKEIDVWGVDRRWTLPAADGDISDLGDMGVDQELADIGVALGFARTKRAESDDDHAKLVLAGFSHGGELTYAYAAADGRHISGIAPLDIYYDIAPADADFQAFACSNAAAESAALAGGATDSDNSFFIAVGQLDSAAPNDISPLFGPPFTNRDAMFFTAGLTYQFAPYTPFYHLASPILSPAGDVIALRETTEANVSAWFASAPPHQSLREGAELDAIWCGASPRPSLANIHVPVFYLGAAGGFGDHGLYSTTRVGSADVTTLVVHRFGADRVAEDFGHGDLLYADDAPKLAWKPLANWLSHH